MVCGKCRISRNVAAGRLRENIKQLELNFTISGVHCRQDNQKVFISPHRIKAIKVED